MTEGGHEAVRADDDVVPAVDMRRLEVGQRQSTKLTSGLSGEGRCPVKTDSTSQIDNRAHEDLLARRGQANFCG